MTSIDEVYFYEICGKKVRVIEAGVGVLICCEEPMKPLDEWRKRQGIQKGFDTENHKAILRLSKSSG
jgi:desulfoferrodoxin-like iron-binding protein